MTYEQQYLANLQDILQHGVKEFNERTGIATYRLPATQIVVDLQQEFPILRSKKVAWKVAADEVFWMFQKQSNNINDFNSKIWDQWADETGSIGKTYGYQLSLPMQDKGQTYLNQIDYILTRLAKNPSDRQCVLDMWNPQDLHEMNLPPCVYSSIWSIIDGKLNCMVVQRSADYPVGVPFDTLEYAMLTHMFARHLGVQVGTLTHVIADSHIYENQLEGVKTQLARIESPELDTDVFPQFVFNENAPKSFWDMSISDFDIVDYNPMGYIKFEVAV